LRAKEMADFSIWTMKVPRRKPLLKRISKPFAKVTPPLPPYRRAGMSRELPITDERLWELWRQAGNMHSVEVDLAFGRLVAEEAVRLEREAIIALIDDEMIITDPSDRAEAAAAIRARSRVEG
jgi:hypothetical protein